MKRLLLILLLDAGAACSGAPFELAPTSDSALVAEDASDVGSDGGVALGMSPDAGGDAQSDAPRVQGQDLDARDAGSALDAEALAVGDAELDAKPATCTPIPSSRLFHGYCPPGSTPGPAFDVSGFGGVWSPTPLPDGSLYVGCGVSTTPVKCRCQETYDCACIMAQVDVATICQTAAAGASCTMTSGAPTVVCP